MTSVRDTLDLIEQAGDWLSKSMIWQGSDLLVPARALYDDVLEPLCRTALHHIEAVPLAFEFALNETRYYARHRRYVSLAIVDVGLAALKGQIESSLHAAAE